MGSRVHLMVDCHGVPESVCLDDRRLLECVTHACNEVGANVLGTARYRFGHDSPPGCAVFAMLDESHVSMHTYAEEQTLALDIFTCSSSYGPDDILSYLVSRLPLGDLSIRRHDRFK